MAGGVKFLQHADEAVLVYLGQLGQMIVGEHIGKLGLFPGIILEVYRVLLAAEERGRFEASVTTRDEAAAFETAMGARQPLRSMTAAMAATWAAE